MGKGNALIPSLFSLCDNTGNGPPEGPPERPAISPSAVPEIKSIPLITYLRTTEHSLQRHHALQSSVLGQVRQCASSFLSCPVCSVLRPHVHYLYTGCRTGRKTLHKTLHRTWELDIFYDVRHDNAGRHRTG